MTKPTYPTSHPFSQAYVSKIPPEKKYGRPPTPNPVTNWSNGAGITPDRNAKARQ